MAVLLELSRSNSGSKTVGLRHDHERRGDNRRTLLRRTPERRRRDRRRDKLRSVIFTSLAFAMPLRTELRPDALTPARLDPRVSTTVDSVVPISPSQAYEGIIREAAALYRVDASLIRSVMKVESEFDPSALSRAGAMGLMQLMPDIVSAFGVLDPFDPRENVMAGTRLLRELLDQHRGNLKLAIASYNAGPTAVAHYGRVPPFRETQGYVKRVTELIADARANEGSNE
jgi:soluble lytic murein transglycosylase-like protein